MAVSTRLRFAVFTRDRFTCQYCGARAPDMRMHVDHVHPRAAGGDDSIENLITACAECNSGKSATILDDESRVRVDGEIPRLLGMVLRHCGRQGVVEELARLSSSGLQLDAWIGELWSLAGLLDFELGRGETGPFDPED